jgi:hypothetical protein
MGDRSPKEGQDGVAHEPGYGAIVALDGGRQAFKGPVYNLGPSFGI